jgi:hypothetical protein
MTDLTGVALVDRLPQAGLAANNIEVALDEPVTCLQSHLGQPAARVWSELSFLKRTRVWSLR